MFDFTAKCLRSLQLLGLLWCTSVLPAHADDSDVVVSPAPSLAAPINVVFIVDNTANWLRRSPDGGQVGLATRSALANLFRELNTERVNASVLLFAANAQARAVPGVYVRAALRPLGTVSGELYARQVEKLGLVSDQGQSGQVPLAFAEAYRYLSGGEPVTGRVDMKADYAGGGLAPGNHGLPGCLGASVCEQGNVADQMVRALPGNAFASVGSARYSQPAGVTECAPTIIVYISHGPDRVDTAASQLARDSVPGREGEFVAGGNRAVGEATRDWVRFLAGTAQAIKTFVIDVAPLETEPARAWSEGLMALSDLGGGHYVSAAANTQAVHAALKMVLAWRVTADRQRAEFGLPLSAQAAGRALNRVYSGQFRPDPFGRPRWAGNLKQYRLGVDSDDGSLRLLDADLQPAIDSISGQMRECARSEWTPRLPDLYWQFLNASEQRGECGEPGYDPQSNSPDGSVVEKGGQAYVGRGAQRYAAALAEQRRVLTASNRFCGGATSRLCELADFNVSNLNVTREALLAADEAGRARYINWARGADTEDEDGDGNREEYRSSLHGAVLHSRPLAIDYAQGSGESRIVVFYGSSDGLLRAVNGNRDGEPAVTSAGAAVPSGAELWAFMPPEYYARINTALHNPVPGVGREDAASGSLYGPDGPLTTWQEAGGRRFLTMAMRRGGNTIYGFDITDPAAPSLLWRLGCQPSGVENMDCAEGWSKLGQTWSSLEVAWQSGADQPYLIMGGGYNECEDADQPALPANHQCDSPASGNRIYVIEAATGLILTSFATQRAVPGGVTVVPGIGGVNTMQFAYAGDTGGNVYRLSGPGGAPVGVSPPADWELSRIAALGCDDRSQQRCQANRKFLHRPDVVRVPGTSRLLIALGSGDSEKIATARSAALSVSNYFFALEDDPGDPHWLDAELARCHDRLICLRSLATVSGGALTEPLGDGAGAGGWKGWKKPLMAAEQVVAPALTVQGNIYFSTHRWPQPATGSCDRGTGIATRHQLNYLTGLGQAESSAGGAVLSGPLAGRVKLDGGSVVPFCLGCGGHGRPAGAVRLSVEDTGRAPKRHVYWRIE